MGVDNTLDKQVEASLPERDEQGRLLPGNTANPAGRPKRKTLTELIHAKLDDTPEAWEAIVAMVIQKLLKDKNDQVLKTFWEYTDGKPKQTIELEDKSEEIRKVKELIQDEVQAMGEALPQEQGRGPVSNDTNAGKDV